MINHLNTIVRNVQNVIRCHKWPDITFAGVPESQEVLVTLATPRVSFENISIGYWSVAENTCRLALFRGISHFR